MTTATCIELFKHARRITRTSTCLFSKLMYMYRLHVKKLKLLSFTKLFKCCNIHVHVNSVKLSQKKVLDIHLVQALMDF